MQKNHRRAGFSVLEVLCVMGCITAAIAMLGGTTWHVQSSMQLRNSATEFLQTIKTARQYAVQHRCRTRVALRAGLFSENPEIAAKAEQRTYRIRAFVIPSSQVGDSGRWVPVTTQRSGSGKKNNADAMAEWARMETAPRSESLVGRWIKCELDPHTRSVPDVVSVTSPLFERFRADEPDVFFEENFYSPETTWTRDVTDPYETANCFSAYPSDYWLTPTDEGAVLLTGTLPENEQCLDPITDSIVQASQFWPGSVEFIRGQNDSAMEELPGIEFQPDGSLACQWSSEIEIAFAYQNRPQTQYHVIIDVATGHARIAETAPVKE